MKKTVTISLSCYIKHIMDIYKEESINNDVVSFDENDSIYEDNQSIKTELNDIDYLNFFRKSVFTLIDKDAIKVLYEEDSEKILKKSVYNSMKSSDVIFEYYNFMKRRYSTRFQEKDLGKMEDKKISDFYIKTNEKSKIKIIEKYLSFCFNIYGEWKYEDIYNNLKVFLYINMLYRRKIKFKSIERYIFVLKNFILYIKSFVVIKKASKESKKEIKNIEKALNIINENLKLCSRGIRNEESKLKLEESINLNLNDIRKSYLGIIKKLNEMIKESKYTKKKDALMFERYLLTLINISLCGQRPQAIVYIKISDLKFEEGRWNLKFSGTEKSSRKFGGYLKLNTSLNAYIKIFINEVRNTLLNGKERDSLFVDINGNPLSGVSVTKWIKKVFIDVIEKKVTAYDIRRFFPTFAGRYKWSEEEKKLLEYLLNTDNESYRKNYERNDESESIINFLDEINRMIFNRYRELNENSSNIEFRIIENEEDENINTNDEENEEEIENVIGKKVEDGKVYYICKMKGEINKENKIKRITEMGEYIDLINMYEISKEKKVEI